MRLVCLCMWHVGQHRCAVMHMAFRGLGINILFPRGGILRGQTQVNRLMWQVSLPSELFFSPWKRFGFIETRSHSVALIGLKLSLKLRLASRGCLISAECFRSQETVFTVSGHILKQHYELVIGDRPVVWSPRWLSPPGKYIISRAARLWGSHPAPLPSSRPCQTG